MRKDTGRHALACGLAASAILHLALLALNPGTRLPDPWATRAVRIVRLRNLEGLTLAAPGSGPRRTMARPAVSASRTLAGELLPDSSVSGDGTGALVGAAPASASRRSSVLERLLRPRDPQLWRAPAPLPESREQQVMRELAPRLAQAGREGEKQGADGWNVLARRGPAELIAGQRGIGVRIAVGPKPPPPAQVVPAPPRITVLASDSVSRRGELVSAYYGPYSLSLPASLAAGSTFVVTVRTPETSVGSRVRFFVDDVSQADVTATAGMVHASLRIDSPGEHRLRVQFFSSAGLDPVEILQAIQVETAPGAP